MHSHETPDTFTVSARWEHGHRIALTFATSRAAFGMLRALYETPRVPFRIVSAECHKTEGVSGYAVSAPLPYCLEGVWYHGDCTEVRDGDLPDFNRSEVSEYAAVRIEGETLPETASGAPPVV